MNPPAFQFYAADWLASQRVALMTLEQEGAYIRLLAFCWKHGTIPADPEQISRLIGKGASTTLATTLTTMFETDGEKLIHPRLEEERRKQAVWRDKSSAGGKKSGESRRARKSSPQPQRVVEPPFEPPFEGCLQFGMNQKATLQSASSSSNDTPLLPLEVKPPHDDIMPAGWKQLGQTERKQTRVLKNSEAMIQIGKFLNRRPDNLWNVADTLALRRIRPTQEDIDILKKFYLLEIPKDEDHRRTKLSTLLNNWQDEVDKANSYLSNAKNS